MQKFDVIKNLKIFSTFHKAQVKLHCSGQGIHETQTVRTHAREVGTRASAAAGHRAGSAGEKAGWFRLI
jgi:hypothetical protein